MVYACLRSRTEPGGDEAVQEVLSEDLEPEVGEKGGSNSSVGGGVRGVVAVLDDGHEMDRCSCDLVKVSCVPNTLANSAARIA